MNFLLELRVRQLLPTELLEDLNIELSESLHESLCVQLHLKGLVNPLADLFNVSRLESQLFTLLIADDIRCSLVQGFIELRLLFT